MSKAVLEFNLPEERDDFEIAQNGWKYKAALDDLDIWLRSMQKYENKISVSIKAVRDKLRELMDE